jgi:hypothetical protein
VTSTKKPEYLIIGDTTGHFPVGQTITDSHYNAVKEDYDVRMKDWDGDSQQSGEGDLQISGRKRDLIKGFLEERRYVLTSEYYHYSVRARGKKVDPVAISLKIQELGLKGLWVHVTGEPGSGRTAGNRKSR